MKRKSTILVLILAALLIITGCNPEPKVEAPKYDTPEAIKELSDLTTKILEYSKAVTQFKTYNNATIEYNGIQGSMVYTFDSSKEEDQEINKITYDNKVLTQIEDKAPCICKIVDGKEVPLTEEEKPEECIAEIEEIVSLADVPNDYTCMNLTCKVDEITYNIELTRTKPIDAKVVQDITTVRIENNSPTLKLILAKDVDLTKIFDEVTKAKAENRKLNSELFTVFADGEKIDLNTDGLKNETSYNIVQNLADMAEMTIVH